MADFDGRELSSPASGDEASRRARLGAAARMIAEHSLTHDAELLVQQIEEYTSNGDGADFEIVCFELLAPAAHRLGESWVADSIDFLDVTTGTWRLQETMRILARRHARRSREAVQLGLATSAHSLGRALFSAMPGDQHDFAPQMLDELFTAHGWETTALTRPMRSELIKALADEPFDLIGLTLTRDCPSSALKGLIEEIRGSSANPAIAVLIGGRTVNLNPAIVAEVGADGTGADARAALDVARELVQSAKVHAPSD